MQPASLTLHCSCTYSDFPPHFVRSLKALPTKDLQHGIKQEIRPYKTWIPAALLYSVTVSVTNTLPMCLCELVPTKTQHTVIYLLSNVNKTPLVASASRHLNLTYLHDNHRYWFERSTVILYLCLRQCITDRPPLEGTGVLSGLCRGVTDGFTPPALNKLS